jgi:hypothetical protein
LNYISKTPLNNTMLCNMLNIEQPPEEDKQNYGASDIRVTVI